MTKVDCGILCPVMSESPDFDYGNINDAHREYAKALKTLLTGRTGIVIAHRLATIRDADCIVVLQEGAVLEQGNHDALIAHGGLYAQLYSVNYASFDDLPANATPTPTPSGSRT